MNGFHRSGVLLVLVVASLACWGRSACAAAFPAVEPTEAAFIEGLLARRQFGLTVTYCRRALQDAGGPSAEQVAWMVELLRALTEQAIQSPPASRDVLWGELEADSRRFLDSVDDPFALLLLRLQVALAELARGELARIEAELGGDQAGQLEAARSRLRKAAREFEAIQERVGSLLAAATRNSGSPAGLSSQPLRALRHQLQQHAARALRNQALSYPPGSSDRFAALNEAIRQLDRALAARTADDPGGNALLLERAMCQRLLGDFSAARVSLESMESEGPSRSQLLRRAEEIRLATAAGDWDRAAAVIRAGRSVDGETSAELDFAIFEAYAAQWRAAAEAGDSAAADRWRDRALAAAEFIARVHGSYWSRRADVQLVVVGRDRGTGSTPILAKTAADLYRKGQLEEACRVFDQASQAAEENQRPQEAFELAYQAGLIQQQQSQFLAASGRLQQLAVRFPEDPRAASAHLASILNMAEAVRGGNAPLDEYGALLAEHLTRWPAAATAARVAFWQAELLKQQGDDWPAVIAEYERSVSLFLQQPDRSLVPLFRSSVEGLAAAWDLQLDSFASNQQPLIVNANQAIACFDRFVFGEPAVVQLPPQWSPTLAAVAYHAARLRLFYRPADAVLARRMLEVPREANAAESRSPFGFRWRLLSWIAQALNGRQPQLPAELVIDSRESAAVAFEILSQVSRANLLQGAAGSGALARVQRSLSGWLLSAEPLLEPTMVLDAKRFQAAAIGRLDRTAGLKAWIALAEQHPADRRLQLEFGRQLSELARTPPELRRGLRQWRELAAAAQPRTEVWFEAKYSVALMLCRLGEKESAAQRIRYLQLTEDLSKSRFADRFANLLKECE